MTLKLPKNKWFYAFLIAAVLAIAGTVVAIVIGVTSASVPEYTEGDEVGIYYYDTADGEVLLTLSGGNKFSLAGPTTNKTGSYTVDGTTIILDFIKDEDGTGTATLDGDSLRLEFDNATLPFLKKVNYTVTFNGTDLADVTVVNGKTVAKPEDPTKQNSVFLGWYSDAAFTTAFDFENTAVTSNMTVYAKWIDRTVGVPEYTVDFDLGYDGAELTSIVTVSGKAYGVTAPKREGYTFGGWYVSMYENGEKLTYAYTENTVFTADTTLFAVWYDDAATALKAPAVSVTASEISWTADPKAASYKLTLIAPDGTVIFDNETVGGTSKQFNFADHAEGEYKISVVAVANNAANNSPAAERYFANKALNRVSGFFVEDGKLVFNAVENAEKYLVTVDCGNKNHNHTAFDNGNRTVFDISNCTMQKGGIKVTVTAVANGFASSVSKVFTYEKNLDSVGELVYNAETDAVVWDKVSGAVSYKVIVTVGTNVYTFDNGNFTSFSLAGYTGDFTVSVVPVADGYNSPDKVTANVSKTNPAAPSGISVNGNLLTWNEVDGANSYEINIGGKTVSVNTNSFDVSTSNLNLAQGQVYSIKVKAINAAGESSSYSETVNIGYYALDSVLKYDKNTVYWSPVIGVTEFQVRVNGTNIINVSGKNYAQVVLTKEGENVIEVRYVDGENLSDWASVTVYAYAVEYDTRSFGFGSFYTEYLAVGDVMSLPTEGFSLLGYHFTGWYNTPKGAAGNGKLYADGAVFDGNAYTVVYAEWTPNVYDITLNLGEYDIVNMENNVVTQATYKQFFTLPVPESSTPEIFSFMGWRTAPNGGGIQITDNKGNSLTSYDFAQNVTLYADFAYNAFTFTLRQDGQSYEVSQGTNIGTLSDIVIPATYRGLPVTHIVEYGFQNCKNITKVSIPDSIKLVGVGAFSGCTVLEYIDIYEAKPGEVYEVIYFDADGVLCKNETDGVYIEMVPRAMTGDFTTPDNVTKILPKAFDHTQITSITIGKNISSIVENAFYYCSQLTTVTIEGDRTAPIELTDKSFYQCSKVQTINLPTDTNTALSALTKLLDNLGILKAVNIGNEGEKGAVYSSIGGILTNADMDTIYYCPKGYDKDFIVPQGVYTIGAQAFKSRSRLTSVVIPYWVTNIGNEAFYGCKQLSSITFDGKRTSDLTIGKDAFSNAIALLSVTFKGSEADTPDTGAITIGENAFTKDTFLNTVVFEKGVNVTLIGKSAFLGDLRLKNLTIDPAAKITTIGESAFEGCSMITSINVPASVTSIASNAFNGCKTLVSVNFETEGATTLSIGGYAFRNCSKLPSILLPDHLDAFNSSSFDGCDALKEILVNKSNSKYTNDENGILYKKGMNGDTVVLEELLFYPTGLVREHGGAINDLPETLKAIGGAAFSGNTHLTSVAIPKGVTVIGDSAFAGCANLTHLTFDPQGTALSIGVAAFKECPSLSSEFVLPAYTTTIGAEAFFGSGITTFTIPAGVTSIGKGAFNSCPYLETVIINCSGDVLYSITKTENTAAKKAAAGVFAKSPALKTVKFAAGITKIPDYTFYECRALETVEFGTVTKTVNNGVTVYTTDSQLKTIGNYAFTYCTSIETIVIPKSVTAIGTSAFQMTPDRPGSLKNLIFELGGTEKLNIAGNTFQYNNQLVSITFPARVSLWANNGSSTLDANGNKIQNAITSTFKTASTIKNMFTKCTALAEINIAVEDGIAPMFSSLDGVLYNADKSVLIYCPYANVGVYKDGVPTYEIVVPTSVKVILTYAFNENNQLKTVTFAEFDKEDANYNTRLLTIGNYASATTTVYAAIGGNTTSITAVNLPSHLARINGVAFACGDDPSAPAMAINFNADMTSVMLYKYAFAYCRAESITLPEVTLDTTANQVGLFKGAKKLTTLSITLPTTITKLPNYTFTDCVKLTGYVLPSHFTQIGDYAFQNCVSLTAIDLSNVKNIGMSAFQGAGLVTLTIPYAIGPDELALSEHPVTWDEVCMVFSEMPNLTTVTFELKNGNSNFYMIPASMFERCPKLANINLNDLPLEEIGANAFDQCAALTDSCIDFTKMTDLTTIGDYAFRHTALERVDLSKTQIKKVTIAFNNAKKLSYLALPEKATSLASTAVIQGCSKLETIVLPLNLAAASFQYIASFKGEIVIPESCTSLATDSYGVIYDPSYQTVIFAPRNLDLTNYVMPDTVTSISKYAFSYVKSIDTVIIPDGVTLIDTYAFAYSSIKNISLPSSLEKLNGNAFVKSELTSVNFRNEKESKLKTIATNCFKGTNLVEFTVPDSVTSVATYAFKDCKELKKLVLGGSLTKINKELVYNCTNLETLVMQEGIESIAYLFGSTDRITNGGVAPTEYPKMTSITIPASVKTLSLDAFAYMGNLEEVIFAEGSQLTTIGEKAFYGCYALKSINIPDTVTSIGNQAFYDAKSLESMDLGNLSITTISQRTFYGASALKNIKLPSGLFTIGEYAFANSGLVNLEVPASVTSIGNGAFENAAELTTVTFADGSNLTAIGGSEATGIFKNTAKLDTVTIPNTVTIIGDNTFENSGIKKLEVLNPLAESALNEIGTSAFENCANLTEFAYLAKVSSIGDRAFYNCSALSNTVPGEQLLYLGSMAFANCDNLTVGYIPSSVTDIGGNPYAGLDKSKIVLGSENVSFQLVNESNGVIALYDVDGFTLYAVYGVAGDYVVNSAVKNLGSGAFAYTDVASVSLPVQFTAIPNSSFEGCTSLTSVNMPVGVTSIGNYAFYRTSIDEIVIPAGTTSLGHYAFAECKNLTSVFVPKAVKSIGKYCFAYDSSLSDVEFEKGNSSCTMDTHVFYNCSSMTEVALPTGQLYVTQEDAMAQLFYPAFAWTWDMVASYTFAGTGIVHAVMPENVHYMIGYGIFENCKELIDITFLGHFADDEPFKDNCFAGCDKFTYTAYMPMIMTETISSVPIFFSAGFKEIHYTEGVVNSAEGIIIYPGAYIDRAGKDFTMYFDNSTYLEIVDAFKYSDKSWKCNIYDKDGNKLICNDTYGTVDYVVNTDGEVIWTNPNPVPLPDPSSYM